MVQMRGPIQAKTLAQPRPEPDCPPWIRKRIRLPHPFPGQPPPLPVCVSTSRRPYQPLAAPHHQPHLSAASLPITAADFSSRFPKLNSRCTTAAAPDFESATTTHLQEPPPHQGSKTPSLRHRSRALTISSHRPAIPSPIASFPKTQNQSRHSTAAAISPTHRFHSLFLRRLREPPPLPYHFS